uniref:HcKCR1 n=1 Tax=Hyphochytrium catenoides TaxID=42384 RepID=UPI0028007257|nr:Chain A, HcKCR1 [Hyphochytrium catenoides]
GPMPFYDSRPPEGWPKGSINDMDYPLLGSICAVCCVFVAGSGIWMLYRLDLGMGYSCKPYKSGRAPEVNSLSGIICLLCGTMYAAKSFDFFDGGGTPFSLNWYWYLDYVFTCPLLILDFAFTLDLPHKIRYFFAVFLTLWCGVAAFVTPSAYRFAYYALGCCWFTPFALSLMRHVKERYLVYPPKCQRWLFWACVIFFGFWPMFPILFIFSWLGTGHISQQAFYIIFAFLDLTCKSIFGILMTVFRLELEEHTEVQGLPLNEPETLSLEVLFQ